MTIERIMEIGEQFHYGFIPYEEENEVCGYEMEAWTNGGVNVLHFIDLRDYEDGITCENILDQIAEISANYDIDEEIDMYRQDKIYRNSFTIRDSVRDFEDYQNRLNEFVRKVQEEYNKEDGTNMAK